MEKNYYTKLKAGLMFIPVCLLFLVFLSSCEKDEKTGGSQLQLKGDPTSLTAPSEGVSETYTVQSTGAWKVEVLRNEKWVKVEPMEGVGAGTFTVTVKRNTMLETRESVLTFLVDGKIQNNVLKVEQEARSINDEENEPYVSFDWMESLEVPEAGINGRYAIRSTGDWKIEILEGADWLDIEPMQGSLDMGVTVSAGVNATPSTRTARLALYLNGEQVSDEFEINQEGMKVILFEDFNWLKYGSAIFPTTTGEKRMDTWTAEELARGWGWLNLAPEQTTPSTYARDGFVKLGKTNFGSDILSPKLSAVEGTQNLQVSFKAVPYMTAGGTKDATILKVGIIGPGTLSVDEFNINNWPDYIADPNCTEIWKASATTRSFIITGATAETQIWFLGGDYDLRGQEPFNKNRIFLDDILVAVKK